MSQADIDHAYMNVQRQIRALEFERAGMESNIKDAAQTLIVMGQDLLLETPYWNTDRQTLDILIEKVWGYKETYGQVVEQLRQKQTELSRYNVQ